MSLSNLIPQTRSGTRRASTLVNLQDRMNDLFNGFFSDVPIIPDFGLINQFPSISVSETDKAVTIKAELPAMEEKDLKVEINKDRITISGEKKEESDEEHETYHIHELSYGHFSRSIALPFEVDSEKVKASFNKSVLTITIEKPDLETSKSKTIPINTK